MVLPEHNKSDLKTKGFTIVKNVFTEAEVVSFISAIENAIPINSNFRKDKELFAIRNLLTEIPELENHLWTDNFNSLIDELFGPEYFNTKSIYFNKPALTNWLVAWHQDTTISVEGRADTSGFGPWTLKQGLQAVQPSVEYLENIYTIRIHLDDCDRKNGALKVIPGSHQLGILSNEEIASLPKNEELCEVKKGGVLIMQPLLLHASGKSVSNTNRRVIHLEFASKLLPGTLVWRERKERRKKSDVVNV